MQPNDGRMPRHARVEDRPVNGTRASARMGQPTPDLDARSPRSASVRPGQDAANEPRKKGMTPMNATQISPIDRLAKLSTQRTARTDRLHEATIALLAKLDQHVEADGRSVEVDGVTLSFGRIRSNVGVSKLWSLSAKGLGTAYLERGLNESGYLHGDFSVPLRGPSRRHLIAFAERADRFVQAILEREEKVVVQLDGALSTIEAVEV